VPGHDPVEGELGWLQLDLWDSELLHRSAVEKVDAAAPINEYT
jgi:hypothetical protein